MVDRGNYRCTRTVMLDSEEYQGMSERARFLLLTMKHSRINNLAGIFVCRAGEIGTLSDQTGIPLKSIEALLHEIESWSWILRSDQLIWIRNQLQFDPGIKLNNELHLKGVINVIAALPKDDLIAKFCAYYKLVYPFEGPYQSPDNGLPIALSITEEGRLKTEKEEGRLKRKKEKEEESGKPESVPYQEIVSDLNQTTNREFRDIEPTRIMIRALWKLGYRLKDFRKVHDVKTAQWKNEPKMKGFLRPATLYQPKKFEGYLNEDMPSGLSEVGEETRRSFAEVRKNLGIKEES